jgi:PleD family two-component response regulator
MKKVRLQLNADLGGKKKGAILSLDIDANKTIIDSYWRRRLEDAKIDKCVEILKNEVRGDKK